MKHYFFLLCAWLLLSPASLVARNKKAVVILTAGQSNTDGRVPNDELPQEIRANRYRYCQWSFGSGSVSGNGSFEPFYPRIVSPDNPDRYAYDAIVYYKVEQRLQRPFYVIKESLGGTAIDLRCSSRDSMYWSADSTFLASTAAADKGGKSLLKAFTANIGACIDRQLSHLPQGYDIKVLLWHQGESDRQHAGDYYANLRAVIAYVRQYLVKKTGKKRYARLPVILGGISHKSKQYHPEVEAAKHRLAQGDANIYVVDVPDASLRSDQLHFDAAGASELGTKIYDTLMQQHILTK